MPKEAERFKKQTFLVSFLSKRYISTYLSTSRAITRDPGTQMCYSTTPPPNLPAPEASTPSPASTPPPASTPSPTSASVPAAAPVQRPQTTSDQTLTSPPQGNCHAMIPNDHDNVSSPCLLKINQNTSSPFTALQPSCVVLVTDLWGGGGGDWGGCAQDCYGWNTYKVVLKMVDKLVCRNHVSSSISMSTTYLFILSNPLLADPVLMTDHSGSVSNLSALLVINVMMFWLDWSNVNILEWFPLS